GSRSRMHQTEVTSGKRPQLYFLCITAKGRLSLRQSDDYGESKGSGTVHGNTVRPINAGSEGESR
ncbi:hypothetical protein, partial [Bacteroides sp. AM23-12]|uniref:hypothetical protein n=1 Tax=Bacteroides sp. AM23-12 TaxID=2292942 RepID=UPI0018F38CFF